MLSADNQVGAYCKFNRRSKEIESVSFLQWANVDRSTRMLRYTVANGYAIVLFFTGLPAAGDMFEVILFDKSGVRAEAEVYGSRSNYDQGVSLWRQAIAEVYGGLEA